MARISLLFSLLLTLTLCACGGGGGDSAANPQSQAASLPQNMSYADNQVPVYVDAAYHNNVNIAYTSVTVCIPGTSSCQTIPNILVDTGSTGLRIFASALTLPLPKTPAISGTRVECASFAAGAVWGPIVNADVKLNTEVGANTPMQLIADPAYPIPSTSDSNCHAQSPVMDQITTPQALFANGILGIGPMRVDCGIACENSAANSTYYDCSGSACVGLAVNQAEQVVNPIVRFAVNNNGSSLSFPSVPATGASNVIGTLTFGIGTQPNNAAGAAQVMTLDSRFNMPNAILSGASGNLGTYSQNFFDSGSNGIFFNAPASSGLTTFDSGGWYAPTSPVNLSILMTGVNGVSTTLPFTITKLSSQAGAVRSEIAAPIGFNGWFDLGLPFFFGRTIFTAVEGQSTPQGIGPYFAL